MCSGPRPLPRPHALIGGRRRRPAHGRCARGPGFEATLGPVWLRSARLGCAARPPWPGAAPSPSASWRAGTCPPRTCECPRGGREGFGAGASRRDPPLSRECYGVSPQQVPDGDTTLRVALERPPCFGGLPGMVWGPPSCACDLGAHPQVALGSPFGVSPLGVLPPGWLWSRPALRIPPRVALGSSPGSVFTSGVPFRVDLGFPPQQRIYFRGSP